MTRSTHAQAYEALLDQLFTSRALHALSEDEEAAFAEEFETLWALMSEQERQQAEALVESRKISGVAARIARDVPSLGEETRQVRVAV